ncbi:Chromosome (plasmid) partitioning protein ParB [hydrothermal vent metagenome]|uniref:Chromosome (Plasmid) partitioning protein ParB n=1 Tax=hydrothermal vent metagenome TaxID=652676 RepID=A0A3B1DWF1_9ZZZZ
MALGRGLGELLGEVEIAYDNNTGNRELNLHELDVNVIKSNPYQPRKVFDKDKLEELRDSIIQHGLLQPIVVTKDGDSYTLIAGERRLKASKLAGIENIKASILNVEDNKLRELALIENIQRDDLNVIELACSYASLINEYKVTHEELAKIVSKSRSVITNTLRLLTLSVYTQEMLGSSKITTGHAKLLIGLEDKQQENIVNTIIEQNLSVRETEEFVKDIKSLANQDVKSDIKKTTTPINLEPLQSLINSLNDEKLSITTGKDYLKIKLTSNLDVEKLVDLFTK